VIERAESLKSYNRDKRKLEIEKTRMPVDYCGMNLAQVDPVTEAYILASALETELLRRELEQVLKSAVYTLVKFKKFMANFETFVSIRLIHGSMKTKMTKKKHIFADF
jgi:hypothetical protein